MKSSVYIGIDVGAISVKLVVLSREKLDGLLSLNYNKSLIDKLDYPIIAYYSPYVRHQGQSLAVITDWIKFIHTNYPDTQLKIILTGSGGKELQAVLHAEYVNAFRTTASSIGLLYPHIKTIFELGGERSRYIRIEQHSDGLGQVVDYEMNGDCAAGTGSFFDQQVHRLRIPIEDVGPLVAKTKRSASIAGRCSVFAKSDMIHAQQKGYSPEEVLKGLCNAVVRNFKGSVTKGKQIDSDVVFVGGMAANQGIIHSIKNTFNLTDGQLIVPKYYAWMGALGAALIQYFNDKHDTNSDKVLPDKLSPKNLDISYPVTAPLLLNDVKRLKNSNPVICNQNENVYLGIDIGSVSTNLALINEKGEIIHGIYVRTQGRPIEVVQKSMKEMVQTVGYGLNIAGVGTTGSGRELIGTLVGADVIKDEITAHKTGAVHISEKYLGKQVDTIFEIGGQDSKFISIQNDIVVDFSLNEACAAGTGSFLEEQAVQMGVAIKEEFTALAMQSEAPLKLGERCTVFMEKEVVPYLQKGVPKEDILAGLAYSVVHNYLNRVVKKRKIGNTIFFQGGTAYNDSVAAAFATVLGKEIIVPPHNGIIGAIGAALLAQKHQSELSQFRGWDLDKVQWSRKEFTCKHCSNECLMQVFDVEGEKSYWGDKCSDRYRKRSKSNRNPVGVDLFQWREEHFYLDSKSISSKSRGRIGIPQLLYFYDRLPFWKTYFEKLDFEIVLSLPSHQQLIDQGVEATIADPCFPIQVAHGHLLDLEKKNVDTIFLPNMVTEEDPCDSPQSFVCPWGQTMPMVAKHTPTLHSIIPKLLDPNIQFRRGDEFVQKRLLQILKSFGVKSKENQYAYEAASQVYQQYRNSAIKEGEKLVNHLNVQNTPYVLLLGRPYNLYDAGLNLNIPQKLRNVYGLDVIPQDFLDINNIDIKDFHEHMFWNYGRKILQAARYARDFKNIHVIFLSNFKCGPDSYIRHFVEDALQRPYLFLQLDGHANDAGIMTRIEAFLESHHIL